jgi:hypothetical protein
MKELSVVSCLLLTDVLLDPYSAGRERQHVNNQQLTTDN